MYRDKSNQILPNLTQQRVYPGKERVSPTAAVYLAAVTEYITAEVLELAGNKVRDSKKVIIKPKVSSKMPLFG